MYTLILVVHVIVSLVLILVILLQTGRGGMAEAMGGTAAQSLFGGGVSNVLTRATAGCAVVFVVTCLSLAYLSTVRGRSILEQVPMVSPPAPAGALGGPGHQLPGAPTPRPMAEPAAGPAPATVAVPEAAAPEAAAPAAPEAVVPPVESPSQTP